jgi:hypothetical protein
MAETYLFYSSLTLFAMGCLALVLFLFFRLKYHGLNSYPKNLSANIFNKTFNVLDPYPERTKMIHSFLSAVPLIIFFACLVFVILLWKIFEYGLLSSFFILIVCLNLMLMDVMFEIYQITKVFANAIRSETSLGVGDIKAIQLLKGVLPRLSSYYLALSILFFIFAAVLGYVWYSLLWFFSQGIGLILEISVKTGFMSYQVAVFLFALVVVFIQIFAWKIKNRFLKHLTELPSFGD